jgi:hypothetical protein
MPTIATAQQIGQPTLKQTAWIAMSGRLLQVVRHMWAAVQIAALEPSQISQAP